MIYLQFFLQFAHPNGVASVARHHRINTTLVLRVVLLVLWLSVCWLSKITNLSLAC